MAKNEMDSKRGKRKRNRLFFHSLRHTFISTCVRKGEQKHLIKRIVGHAQDDEITLCTYSDVNEIDLKVLNCLVGTKRIQRLIAKTSKEFLNIHFTYT